MANKLVTTFHDLMAQHELEISLKQARLEVDLAFQAITDLLDRDGRVAYPGVGVFKLVTRAARVVRNPKTGEKLNKAASKVIKFRPARSLQAALNPTAKKSKQKKSDAATAVL